ncbi:MAG: ribonuclease III domain-containing protein, partial [Dermabacter sp.]|nr:ribonuclease III domain-containing protein [Dermabacter sp.]
MSRKRKRQPIPHLEDRSGLLASLPLKGELDPDLLDLALTHRSYSFENDECPQNERLEYLGDAVLSLAVADHLYRTYPDASQGSLSRRRSTVVSTRALSHIARLH